MSDKCHVSDQFCTASPGVEGNDGTRAKCFACGLPVCLKCSSRRTYYDYGTVRLCNYCQIEYDGNDAKVMERLYKLAGY